MDGTGDTVSYSYNGQDQVVQTVSIVPGGTNSTISQSYDNNGDMTSYVDADNNTTSYQYNDDGQVTLQTAPIGNTTTSYNANDEASSVVDADGGTISDTFDGNGNITTETWILGGTVRETASYSYNSVGDLTYAANSAGTYTYQYNSLGQKTQQVWTDANGDALTLNYTYDASGNLTLETDSQGNTLSFVYNGEGLMTTEIATSSTGTVARTQWSYNAEQQITQIQDYTVASGGTAVLTINNSYDIDGNLTTETETGSGVSVTYVNTYDADNRITSEVRNGTTVTYGYNAESEVTSAGSQTNSFDSNGNLTNTGFSTGTYNEITNDGTWSYYYDGVGNMVEKINISTSVTWNYSYDFDYRLISAIEKNSGGTILESGSYIYDVFNNLVAETIVDGSTITNKFAYESGNQIYADMNSSGTITTLYDTGAGGGTLYGRIQNGTNYWIVQDRQGSVRDIFNSSASSELDAITYTDDGGIQSQTGSTYMGNFGFTGWRYDITTGYDETDNRWDNPAIAQWLEVDPSGVNGGLSNFRSDVGNDWTNATDPTGLGDPGVQPKQTTNQAIDLWEAVYPMTWTQTPQTSVGGAADRSPLDAMEAIVANRGVAKQYVAYRAISFGQEFAYNFASPTTAVGQLWVGVYLVNVDQSIQTPNGTKPVYSQDGLDLTLQGATGLAIWTGVTVDGVSNEYLSTTTPRLSAPKSGRGGALAKTGTSPTIDPSLNKENLADALIGTTDQANRIANAIKSGLIPTELLGNDDYATALARYFDGSVDDVVAFAVGDRIYLRKGSPSLLSDTVHEGTHALDYLKGLPNETEADVVLLEKRAYFYERQYQTATDGPTDFPKVAEMLRFIRENYATEVQPQGVD